MDRSSPNSRSCRLLKDFFSCLTFCFLLFPAISAAHEDCTKFNPDNVKNVLIQGRWKVADGDNWLMDFRSDQAGSVLAVKTIRYYEMNYICSIGRGTAFQMMYFRTPKGFPEGSMPGVKAVRLIPAELRVDMVDGHNWLLSQKNSLVDFGPSVENATKAIQFIRSNNLGYMVVLGQHKEPERYFLKTTGAMVLGPQYTPMRYFIKSETVKSRHSKQ